MNSLAHQLLCKLFAFILTVIVLISPAPSIAEPLARYTVADVRDDLPADAVIGRKRSGLLCTPAGSMRWSSIAPDRKAMIETVSLRARDAGLHVKVPSADDFNQEIRTRFRITATIEKAHLNVCVPWMGLRIGKQPRVRASGEIASVWRVFDQTRHILVARVSFCTRFKREVDSPEVSDAVLAILRDMTPLVVRRIQMLEPLDTRSEQSTNVAPEKCKAGQV